MTVGAGYFAKFATFQFLFCEDLWWGFDSCPVFGHCYTVFTISQLFLYRYLFCIFGVCLSYRLLFWYTGLEVKAKSITSMLHRLPSFHAYKRHSANRSLIYLIFTSNPDSEAYSGVANAGICDHRLAYAYIAGFF